MKTIAERNRMKADRKWLLSSAPSLRVRLQQDSPVIAEKCESEIRFYRALNEVSVVKQR